MERWRSLWMKTPVCQHTFQYKHSGDTHRIRWVTAAIKHDLSSKVNGVLVQFEHQQCERGTFVLSAETKDFLQVHPEGRYRPDSIWRLAASKMSDQQMDHFWLYNIHLNPTTHFTGDGLCGFDNGRQRGKVIPSTRPPDGCFWSASWLRTWFDVNMS